MKKKLILATGLGIGYVLGSRAGREQYSALIIKAREVWNSPAMKRIFDVGTGSVEDHATGIAGQVGAKAKKVSAQAAAKARAHGRTGLAETFDTAGNSAQDAAGQAGEAAANAAAQHASDTTGDDANE